VVWVSFSLMVILLAIVVLLVSVSGELLLDTIRLRQLSLIFNIDACRFALGFWPSRWCCC